MNSVSSLILYEHVGIFGYMEDVFADLSPGDANRSGQIGYVPILLQAFGYHFL